MIIDIHMHTLREAGIMRPTGDTFATPEQLIAIMDRLHIDRAVLLPIVSPEGSHCPSTTEACLYAAQAYPERFIPFCNLDPRADTNTPTARLRSLIEYYMGRGCKGLGEITANLPFDDPRVENLFSTCEELGLPVTFHIGPQMGGCYGLVDDPGLPKLERALGRYPKLRFFGHSQPFWAEMAPTYGQEGRNGYPTGPVAPGGRLPQLFARYPNLYGDLSAGSGFNAMSRDPEFGYRFMTEYQDRLLFGLDICGPSNNTPLVHYMNNALAESMIAPGVYDKIMWQNANAQLGLGL